MSYKEQLLPILSRLYPRWRRPLSALAINTQPFNRLLKKTFYTDVDSMLMSKDGERNVIIEFKHINGYRHPTSGQTAALESIGYRNIVVWLFHNIEEPWLVTPATIQRFEIWHCGTIKETGKGYPTNSINRWLEGKLL